MPVKQRLQDSRKTLGGRIHWKNRSRGTILKIHILTAFTTALSTSEPPHQADIIQAATVSLAAPPDVTQIPGGYRVRGVGDFQNLVRYSFEDGKLPSGLEISTSKVGELVPGVKFTFEYLAANVDIKGGLLNLRVPGGQSPETPGIIVNCAQIETVATDILYASVRTNAIFSMVPGTCHGLFFYRDDQNEIDIEYVTDPNSLSNPGGAQPAPIHYTNQALSLGVNDSIKISQAPFDVTQVHEYRIDWTEGVSRFYIDGKLEATLDTNVPAKPGQWMWNNWVNGNPKWSCGPPQQDNVFQIKDITMYYNRSGQPWTLPTVTPPPAESPTKPVLARLRLTKSAPKKPILTKPTPTRRTSKDPTSTNGSRKLGWALHW